MELEDHYTSPTTLEKQLNTALDKLPEVAGETDPDIAREERNDSPLGEFGIKPAAERKAAREASRGAAGTKRPDVA